MLKRTTKPLKRILTEEGLAKSAKKQHSGEKGALEKNMKKNLVKNLKSHKRKNM